MKPLCVISLFLAAVLPDARAEDVPALPMRDAATHEQLTLIYRQGAQEDPMRKLLPAQGADPSLVNQPKDLISESDFLCFGGRATLVPKKAVLNLPANLADRLKFQPGSKMQSWADFYAQNRGWISTVEVSRVQAEGNSAMAVETSDQVSKSTSLVVATYQGGPISVLPLKAPPPANGSANGSAKPTATVTPTSTKKP